MLNYPVQYLTYSKYSINHFGTLGDLLTRRQLNFNTNIGFTQCFQFKLSSLKCIFVIKNEYTVKQKYEQELSHGSTFPIILLQEAKYATILEAQKDFMFDAILADIDYKYISPGKIEISDGYLTTARQNIMLSASEDIPPVTDLQQTITLLKEIPSTTKKDKLGILVRELQNLIIKYTSPSSFNNIEPLKKSWVIFWEDFLKRLSSVIVE